MSHSQKSKKYYDFNIGDLFIRPSFHYPGKSEVGILVDLYKRYRHFDDTDNLIIHWYNTEKDIGSREFSRSMVITFLNAGTWEHHKA